MSVEIVYNEKGATFQKVIEQIFKQQTKNVAIQTDERKNEYE